MGLILKMEPQQGVQTVFGLQDSYFSNLEDSDPEPHESVLSLTDGFFGLVCFAGTAFSETTGDFLRKIVDPSRSPCLKILNWKRFERRNFLVLRPVLLKNAYFNSASPVLSKRVQLVELR